VKKNSKNSKINTHWYAAVQPNLYHQTILPFNGKQTTHEQLFWSCGLDLDLDPITVIYELDVDIPKLCHTTKILAYDSMLCYILAS